MNHNLQYKQEVVMAIDPYTFVKGMSELPSISDFITRRRMENDPDAGKYQTPVVSDQGALASQFANYQATPGSPPVKDSGALDFSPAGRVAVAEQVPEEPPREDLMVQGAPTGAANQQQMTNDPASAISAKVVNRSVNPSGSPTNYPEKPEMAQIANKVEEAAGSRIMMDQNKIPKWNESDAFYGGLLSMGLNILSGNNLAQSFNAAGQYFDKAYGREKRQAWAEDLRRQGFDEQEIQAYIETGDNKALTDPMEKKARQQQYQLGQYQLQKAMYETSPEYQQYQRDSENFERDLKMRQMQNQESYQNRSLAIQQAGVDAQRAKLQQAANAFTSRDFTQFRGTLQTAMRTMEQKLVQSGLADRSLNDLQAAVERGDNAAAQAAYMSFREYQARAMLGGNATLTTKAIEEVTGLPSKLDNALNKGLLGFGGTPTNTWVDSQRASVKNAIKNEHEVAASLLENAYRTWAPEYGHEMAQRAVRRIAGGSNLGNITFDPQTGSMVSAKQPVANQNSVMIKRN